MSIQEETPGQTKDTLEKLYLSAGLRMSQCPPRGVGGHGREEECLDFPAQAVSPVTQTQISGRKQNETK